jgi:hypothetical protein
VSWQFLNERAKFRRSWEKRVALASFGCRGLEIIRPEKQLAPVVTKDLLDRSGAVAVRFM